MKTNQLPALTLESPAGTPEGDASSPVSQPHSPLSRTIKRIAALVCAVLFALAIYTGVRSRENAEASLALATQASAIPTVKVISPKAGAAEEEVELPGNTQAFTDTPIYARTSGYLKRWYADIGAHVRAGDLLAEIEVPELDQQLHQAEADLQTAEANLQLAMITNTRWQALLVQRVVSAQEADQVKSDLAVKQATYAANQANVHRLEQLQNYERVTAPFEGVITARATDIGALVDSGSSTPARELFHLAAVHRLRVYVAVPEVYAWSIPNGSNVTITQSANAGQSITGTVVSNANAIDLTTRTLNVEVDVDNAAGRLLPGSYVFVHLKLAAGTHSVTIPSNALLFRAEGLRAVKVRNGHVELTPITIGHDFGGTLEVTSGLSADDAIVLDPPESLIEGAQVEIDTAPKGATVQ